MRSNVITSRINALKVAISGVLLTLAMPFSAFAASTTIYDATPTTLPPTVSSIPFEVTSTRQVGDYVHLAGTDRMLSTVAVTMTTGATYVDYANDARYGANTTGWSHPITVNIYSNHLDANGVPDTLLASTTQSVSIPWRPAADPACGTAWKASDGSCNNTAAFNAVIDMSGLAATLPNDVIIGIAFNTAHYGPVPLGQAGPYDALGVGIPTGTIPSVGQDDSIYAIFWDTTFMNRTAGFRLNGDMWQNGSVALQVTASSEPTMPTSQDQCKDDNWKVFGSSFKNQGDCVSYVATKGKNAPTN